VLSDLSIQLAELALRKRRAVVRPLQLGRERLAVRVQRLPAPAALLSGHVQRLDDSAERLRRGLVTRTQLARGELQRVAGRLSAPLLQARLVSARDRLGALVRLFRSLDPDSVLARGYARITGAGGRTLVDRAAAAGEPALSIHFRDGALEVVPAGGAPVRAAPRPKPASPPDPGLQGKLL
jgi:exodeoxyribonuclease VII large subunit